MKKKKYTKPELVKYSRSELFHNDEDQKVDKQYCS